MSGRDHSNINIAIDGPAGAGKSTISKMLAQELGFRYVDTGAMFRIVAYALKRTGQPIPQGAGLGRLLPFLNLSFRAEPDAFRAFVNNVEIGDEIRSPEIAMLASTLSKESEIRSFLLDTERSLAESGGIVMEGRDVGTVVLPDAPCKFFLDASAEERGQRRYLELVGKGKDANLATIIEEIKIRDHQDRTRPIAPLVPASDAVIIDSTHLTPREVVALMTQTARERLSSTMP